MAKQKLILARALMLVKVARCVYRAVTHSLGPLGTNWTPECSFKPDYKVLVTLIYSEHQREASGEETALDLHDGSFKGEVAFSTFISFNALTGHNCGRRPKSVLVRLIAANGTERDRKELKIADAFRYDEDQGQYAVRSDLILHGWCEPKCAETPSTPCGNPK